MSLNKPPGVGVMTSITRMPAPSSLSSHQPDGVIEPGPDFAGGPRQASRACGSNSVHSKVCLPGPRAIS